MKPRELAICGLPAVRALFARDAAAILRLYFDYPTGRRLGAMCRALAAARRIYRCVEPAELEKVAGTVHHGGVVAVIAARTWRAPRPEDLRRWALGREPLLLLDRLGNAHNLGGIVRTAAFFGVAHIIVPDDPEQALPGEATYRIAEGGMEQVEIHRVPALPEFIRAARAFYEVIGAAVRGAAPLAAAPAPRPRDAARPVALVLGNEERGLGAEVAAACERLVRIPGAGAVESLNVAAAAAILIHHFFGAGRAPRRPAAGPDQ